MYSEAYSGGGLWGLSPPGPVQSMDFRGFSGPNGCCVPPSSVKIKVPECWSGLFSTPPPYDFTLKVEIPTSRPGHYFS